MCHWSDAKGFNKSTFCLHAGPNVSRTYREVLPHNVEVDKPDCQPRHQRQQRDENYEGHEVAAEAVCKLLDGGLKKHVIFFILF